MSAYQRFADECSPLPKGRWLLLLSGTLVGLSVYYLNYGSEFHEGSIEGSNNVAIPMRLLAVLLIAVSLAPFRSRQRAPCLLIALYGLAGYSFAVAVGLSGQLNDMLFLNTLLQTPVLWALCQTRWRIDYARWLRFIGAVLIIQACIDFGVLIRGQSLWISEAFVGGFGNPSSFGISCVVLVVFFLFHPRAGKRRLAKAVALSAAAIMSKSLFATLGIVLVYAIWALHDVRRLLVGMGFLASALLVLNVWLSSHDEELFVLHKLAAAGAFIGLLDYDVDTAATVSVRSEMHERTFAAISDYPAHLVSGHLEGKPYWPIDSQVLTYLGSFGVLMLSAFLALHLLWISCAIRNRRYDGKFAAISLGLFGLIFFTNRILDYFPVATIYFMCIAMATTRHPSSTAAASQGMSATPARIA